MFLVLRTAKKEIHITTLDHDVAAMTQLEEKRH